MSLVMKTHRNLFGMDVTKFEYYPDSGGHKGVDYTFVAWLPGGNTSLEVVYHLPYNQSIPLTVTQLHAHLKYFQRVLANPEYNQCFQIAQNAKGIGELSENWYLVCPAMEEECHDVD